MLNRWKITTALVCIYGVVKEFRPLTPFLTPYLESDYKNFTNAVISSQIYPYWTYSYLLFLIPIFFLTDALRYRPIIILEATSLIATWSLLVWGTTVFQMQIMQVTYGLATSAEIAYYSYLYAIVDKKHYKKITSYTRAARMTGKFMAYFLGQVLVILNVQYSILAKISLCSVSIVLVISLIFPGIEDRKTAECSEESSLKGGEDGAPVRPGDRTFLKELWQHVSVFRTNQTVRMWSLWWALASCGIYQIGNYVQTLWADLQLKDNQPNFNGFVFAFNTLLGAIGTFLLQYTNINWKLYANRGFLVSSLMLSTFIGAMTLSRNIYVLYILYLCMDSVYHFLIAAASHQIAHQLPSASYSFVFGCNTFIALVCQTILTFVVADKRGLALNATQQFRVYSGYFAALGIVFAVIMAIRAVFCKPKVVEVTVEQS